MTSKKEKKSDQHRGTLAIFTRLVAECVHEDILLISPDTPCDQAVQQLRDKRLSSIIVMESGKPVGILTEQDMVRRLLFLEKPATPISKVMSTPVIVVQEDALLYQAINDMLRHKLQHIPVMSQSNKPTGVIRLSDALATINQQRLEEMGWLAQPPTLDGLISSKAAQYKWAQRLFDERLLVPEIQQLISRINHDVTKRALELVMGELKAEGWGDPPVDFALIVMGSGGRDESFLRPDQDNGFILEDYPDEQHAEVDPWFCECADRFNIYLDRIGFPLCEGFIMARNPMWRKTLRQWKHQTARWLTHQRGQAMRYADIFFDFTYVSGNRALVNDLRAFLTTKTKGAHRFIVELFQYDDAEVALSMFKGLKVISRGEHKGMIDLKYTGTLPLVHYIRIMSLQHGVAETNTQARMNALVALGKLDADHADYLHFALNHITTLMLKQQLYKEAHGLPINNLVDPKTLTSREKRLLVESFKTIDYLKYTLQAALTGRYF